MGHGLVVLLLGERVDRAQLLAPPAQSLHPGAQRLALLVGQRLGGGLGRQSEPVRVVAELALGVGGGVSHLLGGHLGAGHGVAGPLEPALQLGLLLGARLECRGGLLAGGGSCVQQRLEGIPPARHGIARGVERLRGQLRVAEQGQVALGRVADGGERPWRGPRAHARFARPCAARPGGRP